MSGDLAGIQTLDGSRGGPSSCPQHRKLLLKHTYLKPPSLTPSCYRANIRISGNRQSCEPAGSFVLIELPRNVQIKACKTCIAKMEKFISKLPRCMSTFNLMLSDNSKAHFIDSVSTKSTNLIIKDIQEGRESPWTTLMAIRIGSGN
ncbi:hypothetical protein CAPTEDRAFT_199430 [Capitella teleta]|uniref:Uncharacterized protein n=1 Tax=Capitella teleta TaxID=283909 RepID=R7V935_CAPTE|nr:hypothetical protein CAPTEDRAFT_199430 [Capitella teleta]|eukprot:ELU15358.1 hypothetical protein CAPTEDRAFT_199430 [Capitella teleta]